MATVGVLFQIRLQHHRAIGVMASIASRPSTTTAEGIEDAK